ncbi:DUF3090 domain-containing protein [Cryobacterium sp. TMT1-3]|uniref:DUF3090 domain-containing protein n=1 Tax=Cryobacterium luteum TaxID=1424661 RepID=A0A1H8JK07_9MICO|nr:MULTISPECIES: DUF3090 domain-containing protein [Cryobacterium]TFB83925.1 DUF3090 domain-containing protein [Cryobacterium luteum]TFC25161.1 DUF3090 domain-containing protein [Cryobacterium sp. TMT1-3]SEN81069.1 conserved hypothetical protein [Cryobacterium luteum]
MPTIVHEFDWPDRVVVGTVGLPGSRTFYLQVRTGTRIVSIALEKQQSALLAEKIDEILDQLITFEGNPFSIPTTTPVELVDNDPLDQPVAEEFRTGALSLGWDPSTVQVVIEAYPLIDGEDEEEDQNDDDSPDSVEIAQMLLVRIPVGTARAFAKRTREVVGAGRPMCPLCGYPVDADGHTCTLPEV